jgi:glycosyltransferase involved in cell wall biosynthesis
MTESVARNVDTPTLADVSSCRGLRLLYVIDSLVPAGTERSLLALAPHYLERGIDLHVAYLHDRPGLQTELERAGVLVTCVDGRGGRAGWLARLTALVGRTRPDLVHTSLFEADVSGRISAWVRRVPIVSTLANESYGPSHVGDPELRRWKVRGAQVVDAATARLAVRIHAVAEFVADVMAPRLHYPRARIDVVPRGRDPDTLGRRDAARRSAMRSALGLPDDASVVLAVARHEHKKGLDVLIEAMPRVRENVSTVRLLVAGNEGVQTEALARAVDQYRLEPIVTFLGTRHDVPDLLCAADAFVLASRREGSPGALIEAMALELPVVVSDIPQTREVVSEDAALFVPVGAVDDLADAVTLTLQDRSGSAGRAARARDIFESRFTINAVTDQMTAFYNRALASPS